MAERKGKAPVGLVILSIVLALILVNAAVFGWKAFTMEGPLQIMLTMDVSGQGVISPGAGTHAYTEGATAVLEAYPETGWVFSHWEGPVVETQTPRTMVQVESDDTIRAVFVEKQPDYYYLTVKVSGIGSVFPGAGKHALEASPQGSPVTLTATPGRGYYFESWMSEGAVISTNPRYDLLVDGNRVITANFVSHYSINVSATAGGTAAGAAQGLHPGVQATVTASPEPGYGFEKWTEGGKTVSTDPVYSFNVNGSRSLEAHFLRVYGVRVSSTDGGFASASLTSALAGTIVRVSAKANPGYAFLRWLEDGERLQVGGADLEFLNFGNPVYEFKLDRNRNLKAEFVPVYDIDVKVNNKAWGSVKVPAAKVLQGAKGAVIAVPKPGYGFEKWTENGDPRGTFPIYEFIGERDLTLTAHFIPAHKVTLEAEPESGGALLGDGLYNEGAEATVRAYPGELVKFEGWEKEGTIVSDSSKYTFPVSEPQTLIARFLLPVEVAVKAEPATAGLARAWLHVGPEPEDVAPGGGLYEHGSYISVEARENLGYRFDCWMEDGAPISADRTYTFQAVDNRELMAKYSSVDTHAVSVAASPAEGGIVSGSGAYNEGAAVTVLALAKPGYRFVDWTEDGASVSSDRNYTFTLAGDRSLVANFERTYPVLVSADPEVGGKVTGVGFYRIGEPVTVEARASFGYRFDRWTEGGVTVSGDAVYNFEVAGPRDLRAHFVEAHWVQVILVTGLADPGLAGSLSGDRFEDVFIEVEGVEVLAGAQGFFDEGETVAITAHVNDNFKLEKWTDTKTNVLSTGDTLEFVVEGPTVINLYILPARTVELAASPAGGGTVTGEGLYFLSHFITVEAQPNDGYRWDRWTEGGEYVSGAFRYTFRLLDHRSLVANFIKTWNITTEVYPEGSGSAVGGGTFDEGAKVTLLASYNFGWRFAGWVESPGYIVGTDLLLEFEAEKDRHLVANFEAWPTYNIEPSVNEVEWGYVTGGGVYEKDATATVNAYANYGYRFVNWTEDGTPVSDQAQYSFAVEGPRNLVANFEAIPVRTITASVDPAEGGSVSGAGDYLEGETATLTAGAAAGFSFVNWTVDGAEVSTSNVYSFEVTQNLHVVANFGPWDGVVYDHPEEIIPMGTGYRDPVSTATSITKLANYTRVYASLSRAVAEIAWVTDGPIDLTGYSTLYIDWQNSAGASNTNNHSYFEVSNNRDTAATDYVLRLNKTNRFNRMTESINVSSLTGSYYIRVHARDNATTSTARASDIYVYKIWLVE